MALARLLGVDTEDERLANLSRALSRRQRLTQRELAARAGIPRDDVIRLEAAAAADLRADRIRRAFAGLDARVKITVHWQGAAIDRLLDERHAALVERAIGVMRSLWWAVLPEVTFSDYGERGSIDLFGGHAKTRSLVVGEVKGSIGSTEEMNRVLDVKERLAPKICLQRFGWRPITVSRVLILPEDSTIRRILRTHRETMTAVYPANSREFRAWLRRPEGRISAIWFLSEVAKRDSVAEAATGLTHGFTSRAEDGRPLTGEPRNRSANSDF